MDSALASTVITQDVAFVLPIVLLLLGAASAMGVALFRVSTTEKRVDDLEKRQTDTERHVDRVDGQLGTAMAILGRVEKGVEDIQAEVRAANRRSA